MHAGQKISRRDFVKTSVVAGGALLASTVMRGQAMNLPPQGQEGNPKFTDDGLVKGATSTCTSGPIRGNARRMNMVSCRTPCVPDTVP